MRVFTLINSKRPIVVILILGVSILLWAVWTRSIRVNGLISRSRLIATLDTLPECWSLPTVGVERDRYIVWLDDHNGVVIQRRANGTGVELMRLDVISGRETPLTVLNRKYEPLMTWSDSWYSVPNTAPIRPQSRLAECSASPDGKWLLFCISPGKRATPTAQFSYIATRLDGTREMRWKTDKPWPYTPVWLHDGSRWLEPIDWITVVLPHSNDIIMHDLSNPAADVRLKVPDSAVGGFFVSVGSDERAVLLINLANSGPPFLEDYGVLDILPGPLHGRLVTHVIAPPVPAPTLVDNCVSQDGRKIVWTLVYNKPSWLSQTLHRYFGRISIRYQSVIALWVSSVDGSEMKEIGMMPVPSTMVTSLHPWPGLFEYPISMVQWLPGGKQISFMYKGGLYLVPVD